MLTSSKYFTKAIQELRNKLSKQNKGITLVTNTGEEFFNNQPRSNQRLIRALLDARCPDAIATLMKQPGRVPAKSSTALSGMKEPR
ncbi:hypothetical protein WDW86_04560 [Bdellovibrionota bacterium FG-2]